jgi:hypothetical protein
MGSSSHPRFGIMGTDTSVSESVTQPLMRMAEERHLKETPEEAHAD